MRSTKFRRTRVAAAVGGTILALSSSQVLAAAFALQEQSASGLGNAYAGGAAAAEDASTVFTNPAGMSRMPGVQAVIEGNLICPSAKFNDNGSQPAAFQPSLGGTGGDAGSCQGTPAIYLVAPINKQWAVGVGVNAPFGLKTNYDSGWLGRFQALESKIETINVNPAVSFKPSDTITIGAGASWQRFKTTLTNNVNYAGAFATGAQQAAAAGLIPAAIVPALVGSVVGLQSDANVNGSDSSWGWNIGVLWEPDKQTRIGASYRSAINYTINGTVSFNNPTPVFPDAIAGAGAVIAAGTNAFLANGNVSADIKVPESANLSIFRQVDDKWDVMADIQYTGWSSIQNLTVVRSSGAVLEVLPLNFRNTWRGSIGANYHYNNQWMFRGGVAYDQTPFHDAQVTARLPDNDRTWIAIGVQYKPIPNLWIDVGYAYLIISDPNINQNGGNTAQNGLIAGSYSSNVNLLSAQLTYTFQ